MPVLAQTAGLPLPRSKLQPGKVEGFERAPLDLVSLWNGALKFDHKQNTFDSDECNYALQYLISLFPMCMIKLASDGEVLEDLLERSDRSAGFPWNRFGLSTKGKVLDAMGVEAIENHYRLHTSVFDSTLKDELRPVGKDARFFRPSPVELYTEGIRLFKHMNDVLMSLHAENPIFCKFVTPGQDIVRAREYVAEFCNAYGADGSSWDAYFPIMVASIICTFRCLNCSDEQLRQRIVRYYCEAYCGYTVIGGNVYNLVGQPSGHYNTTVDNCLAHIICLAIHARRHNIEMSSLRFKCCGDDLLYASFDDRWNPESVSDTYASLGVYLEFEKEHPSNAFDLLFVGTRGCIRSYRGVQYPLYTLRPNRVRATLAIHPIKSDAKLKLFKFCSLTQLVFADEVLFRFCTSMVMKHVSDAVANNELSMFDPDVRGLLASIDENRLFRAYMGWEASFLTFQFSE